MALPDKKLKKITLPGDVSGSKTYEIIPERLQKNGYEAVLPNLTKNSTIALTDDLPSPAVEIEASQAELEGLFAVFADQAISASSTLASAPASITSDYIKIYVTADNEKMYVATLGKYDLMSTDPSQMNVYCATYSSVDGNGHTDEITFYYEAVSKSFNLIRSKDDNMVELNGASGSIDNIATVLAMSLRGGVKHDGEFMNIVAATATTLTFESSALENVNGTLKKGRLTVTLDASSATWAYEKATVASIPTKTSDLTNDSDFVTSAEMNSYAQVIELTDNGSATAGTWLARTDKISALAAGQLFLYKVAVAGASTTTLNITGSAGTALGAKTVYRNGTTKLTTQYAVGDYVMLCYDGTYFRAVNDYDADTDTKVRQYQAGPAGAGTGTKYPVLTRYNLTDKPSSYDASYARYYTGVTLDTSNGNVDAPSMTINDVPVATVNYVDTAIQSVGNPMVFKGSLGTGGTITSLPAAATGNKGYTYKVITAGTYQGLACKVGDVVVSDGTSWTLIPSGDEPSGTVTSVGLSVPTGFSVSGSPVTSSGTLSLSFASGYSLPTTAKQTEWNNKANSSDVKITSATVRTTGSGNAVTGVSISNGQIVANKATTFATYTQLAAKQDALTWNPTIPSGATTTSLTAIKDGSNYYSLGGGGGLPTITIALSQVISQDPLQIQLTSAQYEILASNKQVILDGTALGMESIVTNFNSSYTEEGVNYIDFIFASGTSNILHFSRIFINASTKVAELSYDGIYPGYADQAGEANTAISADAMNYLTTAPSSANTDGTIKVVVLSSEPATRYNGYLYIITEPAGYEVTINFTNGISTSNWSYTKIYKNYTVTDYNVYLSSADEIGSISSANGSRTVTTDTGKIFIYGHSSDAVESVGNITVSSGIETKGTKSDVDSGTGTLSGVATVYLDGGQIGSGLLYAFNVTADGTITIDGADWHD